MIDLRSDTVTRPTAAMLEAMTSAEVGDDVFEEDPTVIRLESYGASLLGKEAALFCPSGTMTNQIAIRAQTQPGDEVICHRLSHIYNYEGGGIMVHSGASVRLVDGDRGRFAADQVRECINPDDVHCPVTRLVCVENTCNKGGGSFWRGDALEAIRAVLDEHGLSFHLDGARLFNALAETGDAPEDTGKLFDTISICLSKGLGAPVGSLLLGTRETIRKARRIRKVFGGGMRQAGYLAAAGLHALEHHRDRMREDHRRARQLGEALSRCTWVQDVLPIDTNIVVIALQDDLDRDAFLDRLATHGLRAVPFGPQTIRLVTHLDFDDDQLEQAVGILKKTN